MSLPVVSVIIPTFNRAGWVVEAIDSVLAQDYRSIELIVVDDGSTDTTPQRMQTYASDLTYIRRPHQGVSAARNCGVSASQGGLIAFLDSDDLWLPSKITAQVALFEQNPQLQACYTDEIWIRRGVRVNPKHIHRKHSGWIFHQSLPLCTISPSAIMLRRSQWDRLGGFDERLPACEDYDLWLRLTSMVPIHLLPERLIVKRGGHPDQLSHTVPVLDIYRITALENILATPLSPSQRRAVLRQLIQKSRIVAQGAHKRGLTARGNIYDAKIHTYQQQLKEMYDANLRAY
jgi:glycosyltransferase involved in cell wall biosynthesis